jgi:hypothetical protein
MSLGRVAKEVVTAYVEPKVAGQQGQEFGRENQAILPTEHLN